MTSRTFRRCAPLGSSRHRRATFDASTARLLSWLGDPTSAGVRSRDVRKLGVEGRPGRGAEGEGRARRRVGGGNGALLSSCFPPACAGVFDLPETTRDERVRRPHRVRRRRFFERFRPATSSALDDPPRLDDERAGQILADPPAAPTTPPARRRAVPRETSRTARVPRPAHARLGARDATRRSGARCSRGTGSSPWSRTAWSRRGAAHGRHRGPHRPRQDVARPGADRQGHRPAARGAAARDLDRPRLRAARARGRAAAVADRRPRARALRPQHGRRRDRDRPLPARDRRRRRGAAADVRAPRDPPPARDRARRRRGDEGRRRRRGDARARARGSARARPGGRGGRGQREDRRRPRRAARRARARGGACVTGTQARRRRRRASTSTASSRCAGSGRSRPGRSGRGRSARATCSAPSRPDATCASAASRCTTARSSAPRRGSGSRSRSPASSGASCAAATRSSRPGSLRPSYRLDVALEELVPIADGARLHVHHGTAAVPARVVKAAGFAQLRLAAPLVAARGDRVVLRDATTVGGGTVLDPAPVRHADSARFERARARRDARPRARARRRRVALLGRVARRAAGDVLELAIDAGRPARPGRSRPDRAVGEGRARAASVRAARLAPLPARHDRHARRARRGGRAAGGGGRGRGAGRREGRRRRARPLPRARGRLVRLGDGWAVSPAAYERARSLVLEECRPQGQITLARFRDLAGCGRRDAQLLLERLDADGVTRRVGEARVLRRRSRSSRAERRSRRSARPARSCERSTSLTSRSLKPGREGEHEEEREAVAPRRSGRPAAGSRRPGARSRRAGRRRRR